MQTSDFQLTLSGGAHCAGRRWRPESAPRAIVQLVHGMAEHSARYVRLAGALTDAGFAVYAHDLPGHGPDCPESRRGHFADRRGWRLAIASIRDVHRLASKEHNGAPLFMLGHSMGSFLLQHYVADFGDKLAGAVYSGSNGDPGALRKVALALVRAEALIYGRRYPSAVAERLSFKAYNKAFKLPRTDFDWLSRDHAEVDRYIVDPHCGFRCTTGLWIDLLEALGNVTQAKRLRRIPKSLSTLILSGASDPVGGEKGARALGRAFEGVGLLDVTVKVYPDARHELFNELCRDEVTSDLVEWLGNHLPR